MPRIVDGDNLLGSWPGRRRSDPERRNLIREVRRLALRDRRQVVLVFDGAEPPALRAGPDVRFSGPGRTADDVILAHLRDQEDRRGWIVVTNDHSLADQCRYLGARVERCDAFRVRLERPADGEKPPPAQDLDYWMDIFTNGDGEDKNRR